MKLTEKQKRFADYYIETGNGAEAARRAGYSGKNHDNIATENLRKLAIRSYIDERLEKLQGERVADQQEIMEFLTSVMRGDIDEPVPILDGDGTQRVVNLKPSVQTRRSAAVDLGKRYAMWTDKQQIEGSVGVTIIDDIGDEDES
ncbi:terminase small subunit [Bacillus solitudinis]|uniref:terminase small subunit n=1 Tax=Bacillus solitudinis TaxID=2014074 RepID=UPI000C2408C5|nr:terminase small subunit [Bacillus solitudinis]